MPADVSKRMSVGMCESIAFFAGPGNTLEGRRRSGYACTGVKMAQRNLVRASALAALAIGVAMPTAARADLKFCNQTKDDVSVAIGFKSPEATSGRRRAGGTSSRVNARLRSMAY